MELEILRRENAAAEPYWQTIRYEPPDEAATVALALTQINAGGYTDTQGNPVTPVAWECSCMQKRCGACAMVIDGVPALACDTKLSGRKKMRLEPLRKFPVVADLICDRSILHENLKAVGAWLTQEAAMSEETAELAYEASRCLQCGCCLEVCPNFFCGGSFTGTAAMVPVARLLSELDGNSQRELYKAYRRRFFEGCGKSLACRRICPAGIDVDRLLVNSNAVAVWRLLALLHGKSRRS